MQHSLQEVTKMVLPTFWFEEPIRPWHRLIVWSPTPSKGTTDNGILSKFSSFITFENCHSHRKSNTISPFLSEPGQIAVSTHPPWVLPQSYNIPKHITNIFPFPSLNQSIDSDGDPWEVTLATFESTRDQISTLFPSQATPKIYYPKRLELLQLPHFLLPPHPKTCPPLAYHQKYWKFFNLDFLETNPVYFFVI